MSAFFDTPLILLLALAALPAALFVLRRFLRIREQLSLAGGSGWPGETLTAAMMLRTGLFSAAWILLVVAAAGPQWGVRLEPVREQGAAVIFAVDISRSMTVSDIAPDRLSFAAQYAARLAEKIPGIPCGLVLFKGDAFLSLPLTTDRRALMDALSSINPAMSTVTGTSPARALHVAATAFPRSLAVQRYIILLTDGEQTSGSIAAAAAELKTQGITLFAVGVGTADGMELDVFPDTENTRMHLSRLDTRALDSAVRSAGGDSAYINAVQAGSALAIIEHISSRTEQGKKTSLTARTVKRYPYFLFGAILAFCVALASGGWVWKKS